MKDKKNLLIGLMLVLVVGLSVGYAALATTLKVNGTATIDAGWDVEITGIDGDLTGKAEDVTAPAFTATTATFDVKLNEPGDSATYTIDVKNKGTMDATLSTITWSTEGSDPATPTYIKYTVTSAPTANSILAANTGTTQVVVKVYWDESVDIPADTEKIEETLKLTGTLLYVQASS